jgi:tetratricopeptide (TPR) repeat protein
MFEASMIRACSGSNARVGLLTVTLALATAACASHPPVRVTPESSPVDPVALMRRGCYRCLESAFEAAVGRSPLTTFEVAALLVLRSKELGLPPDVWLERARDALLSNPALTVYFDMVSAVRADPLSDDRDAIFTENSLRRISRETAAAWRESLRTGPASPVFRAYLELSLTCSAQLDQRDETIASVSQQFADVPLLRYRVGVCGSLQSQHLRSVREADPEFVDADYALGRYALDIPQYPDQEEALRRFQSARNAFPASPAIRTSIGNLHQEREEWTDALNAFDSTLALVPTHRDALLGRTMSLSNLFRHQEAIQSATRLVELGTWFIGQAHFWRAWNEYQLGNVQAARVDTDRAKGLMVSAPTFALSGMIAWREQRLAASEEDLLRALRLDGGQCEAAAVLGGVRADQRRWVDSLAAFRQARECFDRAVSVRRELIAKISAGPGSDEGKARLIALQERAIADALKQRAESDENSATLQKRIDDGR